MVLHVRQRKPDYIFESFTSRLISRGGRERALKLAVIFFQHIRKVQGVAPSVFLENLIESARPKIYFFSKKIAGVSHKIPVPLTRKKSISIVLRWIFLSAGKRSGNKAFPYKLYDEVMDLYTNPANQVLKKRDEIHKLGYLNRPFLRFLKFLSFNMNSNFSTINYSSSGRNNTGRITVRHRGGAGKVRVFRLINYKISQSGTFHSLSTAVNQAYKSPIQVIQKSGQNRYCLGYVPFSSTAESTFFISNNSQFSQKYASSFRVCPIHTIPTGSYFNLLHPFGACAPKFARAPSSKAQILKRRGSRVTVKLPSGEIRRVSAYSRVFAGMRFDYNPVVKFHKAGQQRWRGIRPSVRGCAINPVDHPHGGRTGDSRPSVSPWGKLTKGFRTRTKKINKKLVVLSVQKLKDKSRIKLFRS